MTEMVVTSFSPEGEERYGRKMVRRFRKWWPCPLIVYVDGPTVLKGVGIRHTAEIPGWLETREGLPEVAPDPSWYKPRGYLWNAKRFAVKPFVWLDAAEQMGEGVLTWLDGDTVTLGRVSRGWARRLVGSADVAYLGRGAMHPETGYVGFRIPEALPLLRWCRDAYRDGSFRSIKGGWTDCHVLRAGIAATKIKALDLVSGQQRRWTSRDDVMSRSPLGHYVLHLKGSEAKREAGR
jgi:hypothetical protein